MQSFLKKITEWILEKEEEMARACSVPMSEIDYQLQKVHDQKVKLQKDYKASVEVFDEIEAKLQKIKSIEVLRCHQKES